MIFPNKLDGEKGGQSLGVIFVSLCQSRLKTLRFSSSHKEKLAIQGSLLLAQGEK
jgi:hypothetical protein